MTKLKTNNKLTRVRKKLNSKGLKFDGVNDFITAPITGLPIGTDEFSVSIKIKVTRISTEAFFGYGGMAFLTGFNIGMVDGRFVFEFGGAAGVYTNNIYGIGEYTITVTKPNSIVGDIKIFINGNLVSTFINGTVSTSVLNLATDRGFVIGQYLQTGGFYLLGIIKNIKIWNNLLSDSDVLNDYLFNNITLNLVRSYKFDDNKGLILTDNISNYNGTLINYALSDVTIGNTNSWLYENETPYTDLEYSTAKYLNII